MANYHLTAVSRNAKLGPMPASTSSAQTCPDHCPLKRNGCYAEHGPQAMHWRKITEGERGERWANFIDSVRRAVYPTQVWRHNVSGDLVGAGDKIDATALRELTRANGAASGFTYTHYPATSGKHAKHNLQAIAQANADGFAVNLSADNLAMADALAETGMPVVTILPSDYADKREALTPAGRKVAVCPAVTGQARNCAQCGLCAKRGRKVIVGFPAHGAAKRKANAVAQVEAAQ